MRAVQIDHLQPNEDPFMPLPLVNWDTPLVKEGQVLVRVHHVALNFFDVLMLQGRYQTKPKLPFIPGVEFSGIIENSLHEQFSIGQRVMGSVPQGALAEFVVCEQPTMQLFIVPDSIPSSIACGLHVTYATAYLALVTRAAVKTGEWVLIHAAASGVGLAALHIANALGAKVIATCGSIEKQRFLSDPTQCHAHCALVVNYTEKDWQKRISSFLKQERIRGVQVVYDPVGLLESSLSFCGWQSRLLVIGFTSGRIEKLPSNRLLLQQLTVQGVYWGGVNNNAPKEALALWHKGLLPLFEKQLIRPCPPHTILPLDKVSQGLELLRNRAVTGKVVISIQDENEIKSRL